MDIKYWQCSYFDDMTCLGEMNIPMYCFFDVDVGYWSSLKLDAWFSSIFPIAYIYCYGILMSQIIMAKPAGGPGKREQPAGMDED
jgi:hypothetical protein